MRAASLFGRVRGRYGALSQAVLSIVIAAPCARASTVTGYTVTDLLTLAQPTGYSYFFDDWHGQTIGGGQVAGFGRVNPDHSQAPPAAMLWAAASGALTDLNGAYAYATDGVHQVGQDQNQHAAMWSGTADSKVDLHPTGAGDFYESRAYGLAGAQVVGEATTTFGQQRAVLWNGGAGSFVDLTPNAGTAQALATDGVHQVGTVGVIPRATLWSGSADSVVDLHPLAGYTASSATAVSGNQQVGRATADSGFTHAMLWTGSAASAVDLHPTNLTTAGLTYSSSAVVGTNGVQQVGDLDSAALLGPHAIVWSGTADSAVDLGALLPSDWNASTAYTIDPQGDVYGLAWDDQGNAHLVEWVAQTPEPMTLVPLAVAVAGAGLRRRRRGRRA